MLPTSIIIIIIFGAIALIYNSMAGKKNQVEYAFAGIDAMLKKRFDLIPNLIATVKKYMKHEAETLIKVTEMRAQAVSGKLNSEDAVAVDNQFSKAMGGIMVAVENYPELKADKNFIQLQRSLNEIEEQLSASRRAFNASVTDYNNAVEMFPTNVFAGMMNYRGRELFEIPEAERKNVNVGKLFSE